MHFFKQRSITLSLWLALSLLGTAFTVLALGSYAWLTVRDDIDNARNQADTTVGVVLSTFIHLRAEGAPPTQEQLITAQRLGVEFIQAVDRDGRVANTFGPNPEALASYPIDPSLLALAVSGVPSSQSVSIDPRAYSARPTTAWNVLRGGSFAEEYVYPLQLVTPGQQGGLRVLIRYPDIASDAQRLLIRSLLVGLAIISAIVLFMWLLLRQSISRPLHHYSELASQIAMGEEVRMPAQGSDELAELGRAVNGMADALQYQATVDSLTGLYNLRHLSSTLESLLAECSMNGRPLALIVGDLDNLKPINDTYGHQAGDRMLQAVGDAILAWAGAKYISWRLGGDEFVVALPDTSEDEARLCAASMKAKVDAVCIVAEETQVGTSISVGVSSYPHDGNSAGALLGSADRAMYEAKSEHKSSERKLADSAAA